MFWYIASFVVGNVLFLVLFVQYFLLQKIRRTFVETRRVDDQDVEVRISEEIRRIELLASYFKEVESQKSRVSKLLARIYTFCVSAEMRDKRGYNGTPIWLYNLTIWFDHPINYLNLTAAWGLFTFVFILMTIPRGVSVDNLEAQTSNRGPLEVNSGNSTYYEWHKVGNVKRIVPSCLHYEYAERLFENEITYHLATDGSIEETKHARCLLRKNDATLYEFQRPYNATRKALADAPSVRRVLNEMLLLDNENTRFQSDIVNLDDVWNHPRLYVLRDGASLLRLNVRVPVDEGTGKFEIQRRMVPVASLVAFLEGWQSDIAASVPGTTLHYCMCPEFMGIVDPIHFHLDTKSNKWSVWMKHKVAKVLNVFAPRSTKERYSQNIEPFPFKQNQMLVEDVVDPAGNNHLTTHFDSVVVTALDAYRVNGVADEIEYTERFWTGYNGIKRTHDPAQPFALAVELKPSFEQDITITGVETICYYHCSHVKELLMHN